MKNSMLLAITIVLLLLAGALLYQSFDRPEGGQQSPHSLQTDPPD